MPTRELQFSSLGFSPLHPVRSSPKPIASALSQSLFNFDFLELQLTLKPFGLFQVPMQFQQFVFIGFFSPDKPIVESGCHIQLTFQADITAIA